MSKKHVDKLSNNETMELVMNIADIKTITHEDLREEKPKEEYDELLLKVYWYLQGLTDITESCEVRYGAEKLLKKVGKFIDE